MEFIEITENEFKKLENKFEKSNFYQTTDWANLKKINGWNSNYVALKEDGKVIAMSLLLSRTLYLNKKIFYAPRGYLIDFNNLEHLRIFTTEVKSFVKKLNGIFVKIDPLEVYCNYDNENEVKSPRVYENLINLGYKHYGFTKGYSREAQFRWTYLLDISRNMQDIYKGMDQRCRRCIRKYEKYPLITVDVDDNNISDFKKIMEHTAIRQHHFDRSLNYYNNLRKHLGDRVKMIIIYLDKEKFLKENPEHKVAELLRNEKENMIPISAGVFIFDNDRCNYVYGGTYSHYMPLMAQYKLQMDMIKLSQEKKLPLYDFGGISGDFEEGSPNYGVYEFKRGFGGYVIEYVGEFDYIVKPVQYMLYNLAFFMYRKSKHILGMFRKNK